MLEWNAVPLKRFQPIIIISILSAVVVAKEYRQYRIKYRLFTIAAWEMHKHNITVCLCLVHLHILPVAPLNPTKTAVTDLEM